MKQKRTCIKKKAEDCRLQRKPMFIITWPNYKVAALLKKVINEQSPPTKLKFILNHLHIPFLWVMSQMVGCHILN